MSKRLSDTEIWKKPWFRKLNPKEKLAFIYIKDTCDPIGIWTPDFELAELFIGGSVDWDNFLNKVNGNIVVLNNGKWWLIDFCNFQYGELKEDEKNPARKSFVKMLKNTGLWEFYREYTESQKGVLRPIGVTLPTPKEKEKEKEKDKDKDKDKEKEKEKEKKVEYAPAVKMTEDEYQKLIENYGEKITKMAIEKLSAYKMSTGKRYKSDYFAILNWVIEEVTGKPREAIKKSVVIKCPNCGKNLKNEIENGAQICYGCGIDIKDLYPKPP